MFKIPYLRINQNENFFFISKFKVSDLKKIISFHYRHEDGLDKSENDLDKYLREIENDGINIASEEEGIQRRLEKKRIKEIRGYYEDNSNTIYPTTVILSKTIKEKDNFFKKYLLIDSEEFGSFNSNEINGDFKIIDGQHRLAGIMSSKKDSVMNLEISVTIIFNIGLPEEASLFAVINGKQKSVNKSLIYDLQNEIGEEEINNIYKYHNICKNFNKEPKSPLFKQIKMLGVGQGSISQAFFVDYLKEALDNKSEFKTLDIQTLYNELFYYFRAFQKTFPLSWTIPLDINKYGHKELERYIKIIKKRKSQLVKTNGFGALLLAFPIIYKMTNGDPKMYLNIISELKGKINWRKAEGTGKSAQTTFKNNILEQLSIEN